MNTTQILIIRENPYYTRKKPLNKNQKILKALGISVKNFSNFLQRSEQAVLVDFRSEKNMHKSMYNRSLKRGTFYAKKLAEMTGREIDENIFL